MDAVRDGLFEVGVHRVSQIVGVHALADGGEVRDVAEEEGEPLLLGGGLEELLDGARNARRVIMAGPTASPWPPTFFARGVHVLGGIRVKDGEKLLRVVSEGGSGYFFEDFAEKVCIVSAGS